MWTHLGHEKAAPLDAMEMAMQQLPMCCKRQLAVGKHAAHKQTHALLGKTMRERGCCSITGKSKGMQVLLVHCNPPLVDAARCEPMNALLLACKATPHCVLACKHDGHASLASQLTPQPHSLLLAVTSSSLGFMTRLGGVAMGAGPAAQQVPSAPGPPKPCTQNLTNLPVFF